MRFVSLLALAAIASPLSAQDFTWRGRIPQGNVIEIRGISGDLRVMRAPGDEVEVTAEKRADRSDPDEVLIEVATHAEGVTICALYPQRRGDDYRECRRGGPRENNTRRNDVEVHWTVRVPAGVVLEGFTVNGDVDVRGLASDVHVGTVNGGIDIETTGIAEASTVNGSIDARMGTGTWTGALEFSTVNGGITITVPDGFGAEVDARTVNGHLESDFPVTMRGRFGHGRFSGVIGGGGRDLELSTVNGSIRILKR